MKRLVIASGNPGKLREIAQIVAPLGMEIEPQSSHGVPEAEEPHATFMENALAKARHAARCSQTTRAFAWTPSAAPPACAPRGMPRTAT